MSRLMANLGYRNPLAAREFLIQALGFEQVVWHDDPTTGEVHHAELRAPGGGVVSLHSGVDGSSIADLVGRASGGGYPPFGMHLDIEDPDAAYARAVAAGATVVRELQDRFTGTRGFIVADPEGMYWSVATPLPPVVRDASGRWQPAATS